MEAGGAAPGIDLLERLAQALQVSVVDLLPMPTLPNSVDEHRKQVMELFSIVLTKAGRETLSMLNLILIRLNESAAVNR